MTRQGYVKQIREKVGTTTLILPGACALILDDQNRILMQKRSDYDLWGLPAGITELNESAWDTLVREVKEETGLDVISARPVGIYTEPRFHMTYPNEDQVQPFSVVFLVEKWQGEFAIDQTETLDLKFFPMNNLPNMSFEQHAEIIRDFHADNNNFTIK